MKCDPVVPLSHNLGHPVPGNYLTPPTDTSVGGVQGEDEYGDDLQVGNLPGQTGPELFGRAWDTSAERLKEF